MLSKDRHESTLWLLLLITLQLSKGGNSSPAEPQGQHIPLQSPTAGCCCCCPAQQDTAQPTVGGKLLTKSQEKPRFLSPLTKPALMQQHFVGLGAPKRGVPKYTAEV